MAISRDGIEYTDQAEYQRARKLAQALEAGVPGFLDQYHADADRAVRQLRENDADAWDEVAAMVRTTEVGKELPEAEFHERDSATQRLVFKVLAHLCQEQLEWAEKEAVGWKSVFRLVCDLAGQPQEERQA